MSAVAGYLSDILVGGIAAVIAAIFRTFCNCAIAGIMCAFSYFSHNQFSPLF
jgi:hypothetical protein